MTSLELFLFTSLLYSVFYSLLSITSVLWSTAW